MRKRRKIKNTILKTVMTIVFFICSYSLCCLDSLSWVAAIVFMATLGILAVFGYANNWFEGSEI